LHYEVGNVDADGSYTADMTAGPGTDGCPLFDCNSVTSRPAGNRRITVKGAVHERPHKGTDIGVRTGNDVFAPNGGEVVNAGWENPGDTNQGYGKRVTVDVVIPKKP
jgi:murein DD-endopeptidase MepM/ murein hydrolase activator NlpD